ncbi:MAG TPA: hypothetical protein VHV26_09495 [Rhizomicrobium sp.]|nr:hypothetical protein [Rhizomicrobium sp.]
MMIVLARLYLDETCAEQVIAELRAADLPQDDVGLIASTHRRKMPGASLANANDRIDPDDRIEAAEKGAGVGATIGGIAGLLAGLGLLALPGVGPVVTAGWMVMAITGALASGGTGGVVGALVEVGIGENDARPYLEGVRRGGALVVIRVPADGRALYEQILDKAGPIPVRPPSMIRPLRPPDIETNPI